MLFIFLAGIADEMPDFDQLFMNTDEIFINYNEMIFYRIDKFPVSHSDTLICKIESSNSTRRQGLCIDITGYCEFEGEICKVGKGVRMLFWDDTAPKRIELKVITKKDFVIVYNIWERTSYYLVGSSTGEPIQKESKSIDYGHNGAAMIVEEIENGRRYRCNDGYPDEDFDDIIFTVQRLRN